MEYLVALIWICIEMLCLYFACKAFFQTKSSVKIVVIFLCAGASLFALNNIGVLSLMIEPLLRKGISLAVCMLVAYLAYDGLWYNKLVIAILFYFALGVVDTVVIYGTATLLGITVADLIWKKWLYTVIATIGKCIELLLTWGMFYLRDKEHIQKASGRRLALTMIFPFVSIIMLYTVFDSYKAQSDLSISAVIFSIILLISNVIIIYLLENMERTAQARQELVLLNQSMALQTENILSLEKNYRTQRAMTHEFKNQLQTIYSLLETEDSTLAKEYIQQLQITQTSRIFAVNTKHPIVDAILNEKYRAATESAIDISFKVNDLSQLSISIDAMVVLLSNLLDNAIEACQRRPDDRRIECVLLLDDSLFLSIRNTSPAVEILNGMIETTKEPKYEHGYGLAGVRRILTQLDGECAMEYADNWFQFVAEIPTPNKIHKLESG